jgi:hypothetical protein
MNIDQLTIAEAREIATLFSTAKKCTTHPFEIGANYFLRTVTHHFTGKLVAVHEQELILEDAAWIADDGRFADAIREAKFSEVEPFPDGPVIIGRASLIDAVKLAAKLPRSQK